MSKWTAIFKPNPGARLRLFCFPFAGSAAAVYRLWPDGLPDDIEVIAVQPPGRETRITEAPFRNLDALLRAMSPELEPLLDRPWVIFGHSMGSVTGYEWTRYLRHKQMRLPERLIMSGRRAVHMPSRFPDIHTLSNEDFFEAVRKYGGTPEAVLREKELMDLLLPILRADFELLETHHYVEQEPLPMPITVFGAKDDKHTTREELENWRVLTSNEFKLHMFEGEHFFVTTHRDDVLRVLRAELSEVLSTLG